MTKQNTLLSIIFILMFNFAFSQKEELYIPLNIQTAYENETRSQDGIPGRNYWQNRADYSIQINLDPDLLILSGKEEIRYYNNSPDTLRAIVFHLFSDYFKEGNPRDYNINPSDAHEGVVIEKLIKDGQTIDFSENNRSLRMRNTGFSFYLEDPLLPGETSVFSVHWNYEINKHSHLRTGRVDQSSLFLAYFFPRIAVYDDLQGWNYQNYTGLSEYYNDYGDFNVEIEVPNDYLVWATGMLENASEVLNPIYLQRYEKALASDNIIHIITEDESEKKDITPKKSKNIWKFSAQNVSDFAFGTSDHYLWDASSLVVDKLSGRRVLIDAAYNKNSEDFYSVADIARNAVEIMSCEIPGVPFPFPQITVFNGLSEMEYPMLVNDMSVSDDMVVSLTAHEIFHSYFPFYVGINETNYAWMDEGWATFADHLIANKIQPENKSGVFFMDLYLWDIKNGNDIPIFANSDMIKTPVYLYSSYAKAAIFNLILKDQLGDDLFYETWREYINRWNGKHPMPHDYFNTFNNASGQDLNWLFKPWFFDFGYPDLSIKDVILKDKSYEIVVEKKGHYPIPIQLEIIFRDETKMTVNKKVDIWKNGIMEYSVEVPADKEIKKIKLGSYIIPDADPSNNTFSF